jgi:hypothetical protein
LLRDERLTRRLWSWFIERHGCRISQQLLYERLLAWRKVKIVTLRVYRGWGDSDRWNSGSTWSCTELIFRASSLR